jgi:hypothetical protein
MFSLIKSIQGILHATKKAIRENQKELEQTVV